MGKGGSPPNWINPAGTANPSTLADGATVTFRLDVPADMSFDFNYIIGIVARIDTNPIGTSLADSGPIHCQVYVQKGAMIQEIDKGYVRNAYARGLTSVVGMVGAIPYGPTAIVWATFSNFTGASQDVRVDVETQASTTILQPWVEGLSTEQEALFEWQATYTEIATPGSPLIDMTIGAGDQFRLVSLRAKWTTGAAEGIIVSVIDDQGTPVLTNSLASIASGATVVCVLPSIGSNANTSGNLSQSNDMVFRTGMTLRIKDNGGTPTLNDVLEITIIGMIKGQAPTITDNGTGNKATQSILYKRVR